MTYREQLEAAGIACNEETQYLYDLLKDKKPRDAQKIIQGAIALAGVGLWPNEENKALYEALDSYDYERYLNAFIMLKKAGILPASENGVLYAWVRIIPYYAKGLTQILTALHTAGATYSENKALYTLFYDVLHELGNGRRKDRFFGVWKAKIISEFVKLIGAGIQYAKERHLYDAVLRYVDQKASLSDIIILFRSLDSTHIAAAHALLSAFPPFQEKLAILSTANIPLSLENKAFFEAMWTREGLIDPILKRLVDAGYTYEVHPQVFAYFQGQQALYGNDVIAALNALTRHAKQSRVAEITFDDTTRVIQAATASSFVLGPLEKTKSTYELERVLSVIADVTQPSTIKMAYEPFEGYTLQIGNAPVIYLSLLLRYANLSHIVLSNDLIQRLGKKIEAIIQAPIVGEVDPDWPPHLTRLPNASKKALDVHVSMMNAYKTINGVLRNQPPSASWKRLDEAHVTAVDGSDNLLLALLYGVLINDVVNKLPGIVSQVKERQVLEQVIRHYEKAGISYDVSDLMRDRAKYMDLLEDAKGELLDEAMCQHMQGYFDQLPFLFPSEILYRQEDLSDERAKRWCNNPQVLAAHTSFSTIENMENRVYSGKGIKVRLIGKIPYGMINFFEKEVLVSAGAMMRCEAVDSNTFSATLVSSPTFVKPDGFFSMLALAYAYKMRLRLAYAQGAEHVVELKNIVIQRPNHGLAHTYRVMENIAVVANYFAHHAADQGFRIFCQTMSPDVLARLRTAGAFLVVGRESEASFSSNPHEYKAFKVRSAESFQAFLVKHSSLLFPPEVTKTLSEIITHLGDPAYEDACLKGQAGGGDAIFMYRLLDAAHKLDLARCYPPEVFKKSTQDYLNDLSMHDDEQAHALTQLMRYSIDMIKAHGNYLQTDMTPSGRLVASEQMYQAPFHEVSTSLQRLLDVTETVAYPRRTQSYEFKLFKAAAAAASQEESSPGPTFKKS